MTLTKGEVQAIKTGDSTLNNNDKITLEGTLNDGTNIVAEGPITITDSNGQPSTDSLQLSNGDSVNLIGGLTGSGTLTINAGGATLNNVNLAAVQYDPGEFHDKHQSDNCCYYGKFNLWKQYKYASIFGQPADTTVYATFWHAFDLLIVIKISLAAIFIDSLHYTLHTQ